jgi:hypothetical protein
VSRALDAEKIETIREFLTEQVEGCRVSTAPTADGDAQVFRVEGSDRTHQLVVARSAFDAFTGELLTVLIEDRALARLQAPGAVRVDVTNEGVELPE